MTDAWIMKKCPKCDEETVHAHRAGTSRRAHWTETTCLTCQTTRNVTIRFNALERV